MLGDYMMITKLVYCFCLFPHFIQSETKVSTACLGFPGIGCTDHALSCTASTVISITNITFGYRRGCSISGVSSCRDKTCCREQTGDCFTPYNQILLSVLQQACNSRSSCTLNRNNGLNERSPSCFNGISAFHSYSKIEYQCSAIGTETVPVDGVKELAIVSGFLGAVIVICLVTIAILLVFFNGRLSKLNSKSRQNDHKYDPAITRSRDESPAVYNSLNTRQQNGGQQQNNTNGQTRSSNNSQHTTIDGGDVQINQNNQHYEHQYDAAPVGIEDQTNVVYDPLNTREQIGFYNMGNISTVST
ncbi:uncharacterized protein LOC126810309 [Patella vulgata]|uniref:uncharacterized protein LOC126810309 n=1 Tax=Patella vulgata TaxID=6465 RepID=UPI0024A96706|nr:uncharacterized protein LOC126810309 [Patella vulgata]